MSLNTSSLKWSSVTEVKRRTRRSGWRIYTLSRALSPGAKPRLSAGLLGMDLLHPPFSTQQEQRLNTLIQYIQNLLTILI